MKNRNRWLILVISTVVLLFAGIIYAWSILKGPLETEFGWTPSQLSLNFTVLMCFFCLGGLASGLLSKKISTTVRMIIAAVMVCFGFAAQGLWLTADKLWLLYICYGFLTGGGIGIVYNVVISSTNAYFPDKKGIASGIMMMGFGFSTLIFGSLAQSMIKNTEAFGWQKTFILLGIVLGAVILLGAFLIRPPVAAMKSQSGGNENEFTAKQMLKKPSFYLLFAFFVLFAAVGNTAIQDAKNIFTSVGADADLAVSMVGILSICNGFGRIISGALFDMLGLRKCQFITSFVVIAATGITLAGVTLGNLAVGIAGMCLCGVSYGFSPTVSAAFASAFYGQKNFSLNFAILNLVLIPASFVPTLLAGSGYTVTFTVLIAFSLAGLVINCFLKKA